MAVLGITLSPIVIPTFFPKFIDAIQVFQIVSLSIIPSTINMTFVSKFLGMEKSKFVLISSGTYLVTQVTLILILGDIYGINGIATAFVISVCIQTISFFIIDRITQRKNSP
ncbi:polysaccharide biosynthesis C-terminal domain-containing protein [Candidatus Nitrosotenuis chungbukensis]|nr:polysaccharide biosynthesis C-terminal domain-containing protein [Candidatus Nitrosotenuis chungbukensis]WKT58326.1 polysaccharide biosynthesis C-terminal domain-containing protein [Candidatus Nitrosotenuis chungbukensis]